jgi:hypothetical protein
MSVRVDILSTGDAKYPYRVRVTTRDENECLVGVRNFRAVTEADAQAVASNFPH